ncbi:hypothetical protein CL630_02500 [bacterium]|nr:hypothetical protein [bacterium]|tara:strand:- start:35442 stop:36491 length:1050 start_codon:yes stop_codon:yes gene_type:complete
MTKVYIGKLLPDIRPFPILNKHLGKKPYAGKKAYRAIFDEMNFSFIELTQNPEEADFFLLPHNFFSIKDKTYVDQFVAHAEKYQKRALIFAFGDKEEDMDIHNTIIFRYSGYRYKGKKENEIIIPTQIYAGDILEDSLFYIREKKETPTVSFCGWAEFNTFRQRTRYFLEIFKSNIKKYLFFNTYALVHLKGVCWRKKALRALKNSPFIRTSFLIRDFYSANKNTIVGDSMELRREYIENIQDSDFVLIARGDANMAARFYETLVLGRIPVVIDTEWVLPLEDVIDYKKFVVFVPHKDIKNTDKYIREYWDKLTNEEFHTIQKLARDTFMKYLKFDSSLRYIFENKLKP